MFSQEVYRYKRLFIVIDALDEFDTLVPLRLIEDLRNIAQSASILIHVTEPSAARRRERRIITLSRSGRLGQRAISSSQHSG